MLKIAERVKETSISTGTGDLTLAGAALGSVTFNSKFGTGTTNLFPYVIEDPATGAYEIGTTYLSAASTLKRNGSQTILASSNADNAVAFAAGVKRVYSAVNAKMLKASRFTVIPFYLTTPDGDLVTGTDFDRFLFPQDFWVDSIRAFIKVTPSSSAPTFDFNDDGVSILSTKLTVDASENDSATAAVPPVFSSQLILAGSVGSVDCDLVDSGNTAAGALVLLSGYWLGGP